MLAYRISATCPQCKGELILRKNKRQGNQFLGCIAFPLCSFTEPLQPILTDLARQKRSLQMATEALESVELEAMKRELEAAKREVESLKLRLDLARLELAVQKQHPQAGLSPGRDEMSRRIRRAIGELHPDKWNNSPAAAEATRQLIAIREFVNGQ